MTKAPVVTEDGEILQRELKKTLNNFSCEVQFAIVYFNSRLWKFPQKGPPAQATHANKAAAESFVQGMQSAPGSCPTQALYETLQFANRSPAARNIIFYIADGWTDCPGFDPNVCAKQALESVARLNTRRIPIHAIVTGLEASEYFPRRLAQMNGGTYRRVIR